MSQDPVRLIDDPTVVRGLRDDLTTVAMVPAKIDVDAGLRRLQEATRSPDGPGGRSSGPEKALGTSTKGWVAATLGVTITAGLVVYALRAPSTVVAPTARPTVTDPIPQEPVAIPAPSSPPPTPSADVPSIDVSSLPGVRVPSTAAPSAPSSTAAQGPEDGRASHLQEEMEHLRKLRAAASRDQSEALQLAEEGIVRFSDGMFGQEREAIAVEALVQLGRRDEAKVRGARFLARYPRGPFAERMRRELEL